MTASVESADRDRVWRETDSVVLGRLCIARSESAL